MNCFLGPVVEEVRDLAGPVHGLDVDLNCLRLVRGDDVIHGTDVASWFDPDCVSRLYLHGRDVIGGRADLVGADGAHGVHRPSVLDNLKIFSLASDILNRQ